MSYVELHCHSHYSLLDGTCSPSALVARAAQLGMPALALTDHDAIYGVPEFVEACAEAGIRPIFGAELTLNDHSHLTLLVKDATGWHNLCQLISLARHHAPKGKARLPKGALLGRTAGLIALSGCRKGGIAQTILRREDARAVEIGRYLQTLFGDDFWIELQHHHQPHDSWLVDRLAACADHLNVGIVATNNVHYSTPDKQRLQDVLVSIDSLTTLDAGVGLLRPNREFHLKDDATMRQLFARYPAAVINSAIIAAQCEYTPSVGLQALPAYPTGNRSAVEQLRYLCQQGLQARYTRPSTRVRQQLEHELRVIHAAGLSNYFLVVWDVVRHAREQRIPCQGRGSAANSLVAYLLHISPIDPIAHDLVFERFLSAERQLAPDIDIDFCARRREEVIQYVYATYGHDHAAMACTFSTFRTRQAIRDVTRALGLSADHAAYALDLLYKEDVADQNNLPIDKQRPPATNHLVLDLVQQLRGLPRHLGIHNGGMIVMADPLATRLATEPATMANRFVTQWDKDGLERMGVIKIDILGLRTLTAIHEAVEIVRETMGEQIELEQLTYDDPAVYEMVTTADTMGVFQVESRAQAQALPRMRPRCFTDLIVQISLIRPGPVQGNMVHPYLNRRAGTEAVTYLHSLLEPALKETLGVILFQEQVLRVARDVAGFTAGQGELLRRALGSKYAHERIAAFRAAFVEGAMGRGVSAEIAHQIFDQLQAFGGYSFAKSHAAAFAVLVYRSAWLRKHHYAAYFTTLFNNQPMGFWTPAVLTGDARRHGVTVLPVSLERSHANCVVEDGDIRLGFSYVKGFGEEAIARLVNARERHGLTNLKTLCQRTRLPKRLIEKLILAGACDHWGIPRRKLLWQLGKLRDDKNALPLADVDDGVRLPQLSEAQASILEAQAVGLSTGRHVMAQIRPNLPPTLQSSRDLAQLPTGKRVNVAGLLVIRQQPYTAKGFVFICIEDEFGLINVVLRPKVAERFRPILTTSRLLHVTGIVEKDGMVTNLIATFLKILD